MIKHIVFWKLKAEAEGGTAAENARKAKRMLENLQGKIPGLLLIEVGIDFLRSPDSSDIVMYSEFENQEALESYHHHPAHEAIKGFIGAIRSERRVVDYEITEASQDMIHT